MVSIFRRSFSFFLVVFVSLQAVVMRAEASCGSMTCPLDTRSQERIDARDVVLSYGFEYIDQDQPRIDSHKASVGEIRGHHDEVRTINRIHRLSGSIGVSPLLSIDLSLPFISRSHRHIHHHMGTDFLDGWGFSGVGDLTFLTRWTLIGRDAESKGRLSLNAGAEFPTGKSHVENDDGDEAETGITPGSGSYDGLIGASWTQSFSAPLLFGDYAKAPWFVSVLYKINGKGVEDYRLGNTLQANLGLAWPVTPSVALLGQLNAVVREMDNQGETHEEVEKTGGEFLYLSPGIQLQSPSQTWSWSTFVQIPAYQHVNEIQLTSDYNVTSQISYRFKL